MFIFPDSLSQLVFQYPTVKQTAFSTQVSRFVGGGEQRYQIAGSERRQWTAQPLILSDEAMTELELFFLSVGGTATSFQFTDPWDGTIYPICYFKDDPFTRSINASGRNAVLFTVIEGLPQV